LHVVAAPLGHTVGSPAAHEVISQLCVPAVPSGHFTTHFAPAGQATWQGPPAHVKLHALSSPHVHVPLAQVPSHFALFPAHVTWQGGASQVNAQLAPSSHVQVPFAHAPEHVEPWAQST
jgi:hypothetical protein